MKLFCHHVYEFHKGLRDLVLHTANKEEIPTIEKHLHKQNISYVIIKNKHTKYNVFFGYPKCIDIIKSFGDKKLKEYTTEEDFILGIMLGYGRRNEYERYLQRKHHVPEHINDIAEKID